MSSTGFPITPASAERQMPPPGPAATQTVPPGSQAMSAAACVVPPAAFLAFRSSSPEDQVAPPSVLRKTWETNVGVAPPDTARHREPVHVTPTSDCVGARSTPDHASGVAAPVGEVSTQPPVPTPTHWPGAEHDTSRSFG